METNDENENLTKEEKLEQGQIFARVILEMVGKPKEHIETTFRSYIGNLKADKKFVVTKEHIAEVRPLKELFSTFAELEMWVKDIPALVGFCFDYMPSSVEIIEPDQFIYKRREFSDFITDLQGRLHSLDVMVKNLNSENKFIKNNLKGLVRNMIELLLKQKPMTADQISSVSGIGKKELEMFLEKLAEQGKIEKENDQYKLKIGG